MKLTETIIARLPVPTEHKMVSDDLTTGLYLKLYAKSGRKSFIYRARTGGKWEVVTLGSFPDMTLAAARQRAADMSRRAPAGGGIRTFGDLLDEWFATRIEPRYKVTANIETYVARGKAALGSKQLSVLTTVELVGELKKYAKASPVAANRCLSNWKLCLDYGVECGYLQNNPLARTTARAVGGEEKARERTLTDEEIRVLWSWDGQNASLLRFLLLTGLRISEGQNGRQDGSLWLVEENKSNRPHWVHLPALAAEQIDVWQVSPTAVQAWLKRRLERDGMALFTPHDLRRTFRTRLAALGVAPHVAEKMINHKLEGILAVYDQHDYKAERIAAAELWAAEVKRIVSSHQ